MYVGVAVGCLVDPEDAVDRVRRMPESSLGQWRARSTGSIARDLGFLGSLVTDNPTENSNYLFYLSQS